MAHQEPCDTSSSLLKVDTQAREKLQNAVGDLHVDYFETENDFCEVSEMQAYLVRNSYTVHPCVAVANAQYSNKMCGMFTSIAPPPYEVCCAIYLISHNFLLDLYMCFSL